MAKVVSFKKSGSIGVITIDNPPVNALSHSVREQLVDRLKEAEADGDVQAILIHCAGRTFSAGADIAEFGEPLRQPDHEVIHRQILDSKKLVVAALHGTVYGGGLELTLPCHYRCAHPETKLGTPEVKLGLLPGGGGTQRLPRLIGVKPALDMIVSGDPVTAEKALKLGLIDEILVDEKNFSAAATEYTASLLNDSAPLRNIDEAEVDVSELDKSFFDEYRQSIARRTRGLLAPEKCIQAVEAAITLPIEKGLSKERELFMECLNSPQSAGLRHIFFAERQAAHIPGIDPKKQARPIQSAAVIGAGTMGSGIAMNFANAGIPVTIIDVESSALEKGLENIKRNYQSTMKKGKISQHDFEKRMALITGSTDMQKVADVDVVIEAVFENMKLKKEVFKELDSLCKQGALLASNTSTLDIDEIASATNRPDDVLGLHFFVPANVMKLLEVVRGDKTSPEVIATAMNLTKKIGKVGVLSGVCYGFIGNRMLEGYIRECGLLLLEGAMPEEIDKAMVNFGMPMGLLSVFDISGIDVGYRIRQENPEQYPDDERYALIVEKLYEKGRYGLKTGAGFYKYEKGDRKPHPDPEVHELIRAESERLGITRRAISEQEIVQRCVFALINEGANILQEGIALRPGDIDVVWVYGYGFPAYRGGPMFYADTLGLKTVLDTILKFRKREPLYWEPAPLLKDLADQGKSFADFKENNDA